MPDVSESLSFLNMSITDEYIDSLLDELFDEVSAPGPDPVPEPTPEPAPSNEPLRRCFTDTGKGAQGRVRATEGVRYVFQADPRGPSNAFIGSASEADRSFHCATLISQGVEVVERVAGDRPARPYIDVDAPSGASDADLQSIVDAFTSVAAEVGAPDDRLAPVINACDRPGKRSRHLVADGWALPDGLAVQRFAERVKDAVTGPAAEWIDRSGGRLSYGLRVAGCPKAGDSAATLTGPLVWLQTDGEPIVDWGAAGGEPARPAIEEGGSGGPLQNFLDSIATSEFGSVFELSDAAPGCLASYDRTAPGYCKACARHHERAGAYVSSAPDGSLFLRCRRTPKHGPALLSKLAAPIPAEFPPADLFDDLAGNSFEIVGGPGMYNKEAIGDDGVSDLYVASAWGTGKSVHNSEIAKTLRERDPEAVVLVVSSRKSLTAQLAHDMGAVAYDKIKGTLDPKASPVSVWQLDSLGRLPSDMRPDLLIIDEPSQLVAHAYNGGSDNTKDNARARAGVSTLRCLIKAAGRLVLTDNDLTSAQVDAFKALRPAEQPFRVVRNAFRPWANVSVRILTGEASKGKVLIELWDWLEKQDKARKEGRDWAAASVACHSKKVARAIASEAELRFGLQVRLYTSETGDADKRRDFSDATKAWAPEGGGGPLVVIYTGTVSVGVSCSSERFQRCFAFFGRGNAASTQSTQMLFRCRHLQEVLVSYAAHEVHAARPQQPEDLFGWVLQARNLSSLPDEFRNDRAPFINAPTSTDPLALKAQLRGSFEGQLWIANEMERHRSDRWFVQRMVRIIERAGIAVEVEAVSLAKEEPKERAQILGAFSAYGEASEAAEMARANMMAEAMPERHEAALDALTHNVDDELQDRTEEEKAGDRALYVVRNLSMDAAELVETRAAGGPWLRYYEPYAAPYKNAKRIVGGLGGRDPKDHATASEREADGLVKHVFQVLGADACAETLEIAPTLILGGRVIELAGRINSHCARLFNDSHGARRAKAIGSTKTTPGRRKQAVLSTLNEVLAYVGAELVAKYASARQKKQGVASHYKLRWGWTRKAAPEPRPTHPLFLECGAQGTAQVAEPRIIEAPVNMEDLETLLGELTTTNK